MSDQSDDTQRDNDDAIWQNSITLSPNDTRDTKIHVTLRLDADVYRAILTEKKLAKERTVTSTIERLLHRGLESGKGPAPGTIDAKTLHTALRNLLVHSSAQDAIIEMVARHVKPRSAEDRQLIEDFRKLSFRHEDTEQWITNARSEQLEYRALLQRLFGEPAPTKKTRAVAARRSAGAAKR